MRGCGFGVAVWATSCGPNRNSGMPEGMFIQPWGWPSWGVPYVGQHFFEMKIDNKSKGCDTILIQNVCMVHLVVPGGSKACGQIENKMCGGPFCGTLW